MCAMAELRKNDKRKGYAHFGPKISMKNRWVWDYITNPDMIAKHNFYPFISYRKNYTKYNVQKIFKYRELSYSTHLDRCIFKYYAYLLNKKYNKYLSDNKLNDVVIAYRTNFGKNNIHFAYKAIDFIRNQQNCYILIGDFTDFFGSLQHHYLKNCLCNLLGKEQLAADYYAVYKNITRYAYCNWEDIVSFLNCKYKRKKRKFINEKKIIMSEEEIKRFKKERFYDNSKGYHKAIEKNTSGKGIPQGAAISAVFANIYMMYFDKYLYDYISDFHGLYMRYSDDFIIVLPKKNIEVFQEQYRNICELVKRIPGLDLNANKTQFYEYNQKEKSLTNRNDLFIENKKSGNNSLNYLGFSFDGKVVKIRDKTITKYYYRMYRKVKGTKFWSKEKKRTQEKSLYKKYSASSPRKNNQGKEYRKGNFLSYVKRARYVFKEDGIDIVLRRHMVKIKRALSREK